MTIDLDMGDGTPKNLVVRAFAKPRPDAVLRWDPDPFDNDWSTPFFPYLVDVQSYRENAFVKFVGVDLLTGEDIDGGPHEIRYNLDVYSPYLPSTLRGWSEATPYAILFLSAKYERLEELTAAKGKGVLGRLAKLKDELKRFRSGLDESTRDPFDKVFSHQIDE